MIVAFSAWRKWTDELFIQDYIDQCWGEVLLFGAGSGEVVFRIGDAVGGDAIITKHLRDSGAEPIVYVAHWTDEHEAAGPIRNRRMLLGLDGHDPRPRQPADLLVAFPEPGRSKRAKNSGTWNATDIAHFHGIEVRIPGYRVPLIERAEVAEYYQLTIGAQS